jgi:poly(A)-specific ribonuclease
MDVNKQNFAASVNEIVALIERSAFAAIDLEMTGISSPLLPETPLCTPEETYLAKRDAAKRYNIIQVGLCLFEEISDGPTSTSSDNGNSTSDDASAELTMPKPSFLGNTRKNCNVINSADPAAAVASKTSSLSTSSSSSSTTPLRLIARPFNFFVFPSGAPGGSQDLSAIFPPRDVTISADAASFLRSHGMDWSRWINTGVSYCNRIEMIAARDRLWRRREEERAAAPRVARDARAALTDDQRAWLDAAVVHATGFALDCADKPPGTEYVLPPIRSTAACTALKAALASDTHLSSLLAVSFRGRRHQHDAILVRRTLTPEEETSKMVLDAVGFSTVFQALLAQRRPIVGHNSFADWCFMMESFFEPLPPTLPMFKQMMRTAAPSVFDTKILAGGGTFSGPDEVSVIPPSLFEATHLEGLFKAFGGLRSANTVNNNATLDLTGGSSGANDEENSKKKVMLKRKSDDKNSKQQQSSLGGAGSRSLLEISLPLGFTNYDSSAGKSSAAHEAGFDALMTGAVFGHFLTRFASTPLMDAAENKLALFRSLYAIDLSAPSCSSSASSSAAAAAASFMAPLPKSSTLSDSITNGAAGSSVYLPGRHELLLIQHGLGSNAAPVELALRSAVENVSFFYNLGDGEAVACIGNGPVDETKTDMTAPSTVNAASSSAVLQRQKAVTAAQLDARIAEELERLRREKKQKEDPAAAAASASADAATPIKKYTDAAALQTLSSMTRTHVLPPHLQWPAAPPSQQTSDAVVGGEKKSKFANFQPVPVGAKGYVPPPQRFGAQQFLDRDFRSLFKTLVLRRK